MKEIPLTKGMVAIVDDEDFEWLSKFNWRYHKGYASRTTLLRYGKRKTVLMHREIIGNVAEQVDHIDGNRLNNTRENLRAASRSENCRNTKSRTGSTSEYKGVSFDKGNKKWRARIKVEYKEMFLGYFNNPHDAARMYNFWAKDLFGEFARLNIIKEEEKA
ncbi:Fis family transcriptional regulator [Bacillus sp. Y1]|nr:HNH endonuclease [Bacillus sp. Y1]AYA77376.1 Fis family transcriptional regulator [Bacillus sp. Y1]